MTPLPLSWEEVIRLEPRLGQLEEEIRAIEDDGTEQSFCANAIWYGDYKPEVLHLTGWFARKPELQSEAAYSLACRTLYRRLPACRNCGCL